RTFRWIDGLVEVVAAVVMRGVSWSTIHHFTSADRGAKSKFRPNSASWTRGRRLGCIGKRGELEQVGGVIEMIEVILVGHAVDAEDMAVLPFGAIEDFRGAGRAFEFQRIDQEAGGQGGCVAPILLLGRIELAEEERRLAFGGALREIDERLHRLGIELILLVA